MKCSVLIPSYQRGRALLACLQAVVTGALLPHEVVVVLRDTDTDSHKMLRDWLATAPHAELFRVVEVTQRGQIAAMNRGLEAVTGDVVVFTDDDAVPRADWLERLLSHYDDPQVGGAGGRDVVHHGDRISQCHAASVGKITWYGKVIGNHHCDFDGGAVAVDHIKGVNMSFRRELIKPFDSRIWGPHFNDTDLALAVSRAGHKLVYDPQAIIDHYPAARADNPAGRDLADPRQVYLDSHDHCHLLMKHRPHWQMLFWLPYLALVGSRQCPGLLLFLLELIRFERAAAKRFAAVLSGMWAALFRLPRPEGI